MTTTQQTPSIIYQGHSANPLWFVYFLLANGILTALIYFFNHVLMHSAISSLFITLGCTLAFKSIKNYQVLRSLIAIQPFKTFAKLDKKSSIIKAKGNLDTLDDQLHLGPLSNEPCVFWQIKEQRKEQDTSDKTSSGWLLATLSEKSSFIFDPKVFHILFHPHHIINKRPLSSFIQIGQQSHSNTVVSRKESRLVSDFPYAFVGQLVQLSPSQARQQFEQQAHIYKKPWSKILFFLTQDVNPADDCNSVLQSQWFKDHEANGTPINVLMPDPQHNLALIMPFERLASYPTSLHALGSLILPFVVILLGFVWIFASTS